ncbi:hypothetical protein BV25DRAFT_1915862 [Artomyces pyxidatus]|uniref:Uncharacterized protein n=1 Tax=Artomyces pyxidatus TaxID=48021 RepID=A0ACB8T3M1_9AGAM|nr:hypothetical protein BV25DRAFT_1915862 [Artomyces pyxidatus]
MSKHVEKVTVERITYESALPPSEVLARLDKLVHRDASEGKALPALITAKTKEELVQRMEDMAGGDLMLFGTLRPSEWFKTYFERDLPVVSSYNIGNPLSALPILTHTLLISLYMPTKILILGKDTHESKGTKVVYDLPSSLIEAGDRAELREALLALDVKLEDLVKKITGAL